MKNANLPQSEPWVEDKSIFNKYGTMNIYDKKIIVELILLLSYLELHLEYFLLVQAFLGSSIF